MEAYNIVERTMRLNNITSFHWKILTVFDDDIGSINCLKRFSTIRTYFVIEKLKAALYLKFVELSTLLIEEGSHKQYATPTALAVV